MHTADPALLVSDRISPPLILTPPPSRTVELSALRRSLTQFTLVVLLAAAGFGLGIAVHDGLTGLGADMNFALLGIPGFD